MGSKDRIKFPSSNQRSSQHPDQKLGIHEIKATVHNGVILHLSSAWSLLPVVLT